jgi:hypothetical protein
MHSQQIQVSFFAAGILAHLCSEGSKFWSITSIDFETISNELVVYFL